MMPSLLVLRIVFSTRAVLARARRYFGKRLTKAWAYGDRGTSGPGIFSKELTKCDLNSVEC